jgi:hypothetical protein
MIGFSHYADELCKQLAIASERGDKEVLIDAGNIHYSLSARYELNSNCWAAMEAAMCEGDLVRMMGLSVCYRLPRPH